MDQYNRPVIEPPNQPTKQPRAVPISISLSPDMVAWADRIRKYRRMTRSELFRAALTKYLEHHDHLLSLPHEEKHLPSAPIPLVRVPETDIWPLERTRKKSARNPYPHIGP